MRKGSYRNERFSPFYRILSQQKQGAKMKRSVILFVAALFLILQGSVMAQDMLVRRDDGQSSLPQLQSGLPDPAAVLGTVGSLYQQGYQYYDKLYDAYLYPRPEAAEDFINSYTSTAGNAGFIASADVIDGYNALRIRPIGNDSLAALLFYDYQGYMMFMVPDGMTLTMNIEPDENGDTAQLVQMGNSAIQSQDYQRAIRYLIRAAEQYLRTPETPAADAAPAENGGVRGRLRPAHGPDIGPRRLLPELGLRLRPERQPDHGGLVRQRRRPRAARGARRALQQRRSGARGRPPVRDDRIPVRSGIGKV